MLYGFFNLKFVKERFYQ